ncbi:MAG: hypothetical protein DRJ42_13200 [Deltaproteobacteria bacterium]|nr:MAG: hypothetical protein DRJ42_13200 [Deltaproteobacteria bacterium]
MLLLAGCEERVRPPLAPAPDGSTDAQVINPPLRDSSVRDSARDAAIRDGAVDAIVDGDTPDVSLPLGCYLAGAGTGTDAVVELGGEGVPFGVHRSYATWDGARCDVPTLVVGLTTGSCVPSVGERLVFSIRRDAIGTNLFLGPNTIVAEPDDSGLTVRFTIVDEQWGTCLGSAAAGTVDFSSLDSLPGSRLTATYTLTLGDCREPFASAPVEVTGSFDVPFEVAFDTICL